jgi:hypothetical protein
LCIFKTATAQAFQYKKYISSFSCYKNYNSQYSEGSIIITGLWAEQPTIMVQFPAAIALFSSSEHTDQLWEPSSLLFNGKCVFSQE